MSAFDIERLARPLVAIGAFSLRPLPDAPAGQFAAWQVPASCTRIEQALMVPSGPADGRGGIRLVKFHGAPQRVMRSSQRSWDTGGIFDVDVYSHDVDRVYRTLQTHGWTALGEPVDYTEAMFHVRQVVAVGPDGLVVAIIQRYSPPVEGLPPFDAMSRVFNSTQIVSDYDRSARYYREVLGWPAGLEFRIEGAAEPGAEVLGLPMPQAVVADRRIGIFQPAGATEGSVELIENRTMRGRDCAEHCVAPNVGLLSLRFAVCDAAGYAAAITQRGGMLYEGPATYEIAPYGPVTAFSTRTPDGAILEFYQPSQPA
jgi:catechol 2,3-dioxygenase-like lactoylglutathione lyase family enzyme